MTCKRCSAPITNKHPRAYKRTQSGTAYHWPCWERERMDNFTGGLVADRGR